MALSGFPFNFTPSNLKKATIGVCAFLSLSIESESEANLINQIQEALRLLQTDGMNSQLELPNINDIDFPLFFPPQVQ